MIHATTKTTQETKIGLTPEIIAEAREAGILEHILPSGSKIHFTFTKGRERNSFDVGRDETHTYLILHKAMKKKYVLNNDASSKGWPSYSIRPYIKELFNSLPDDIKKIAVPMHIKQMLLSGETVESEDMAFLLSAVNVFGYDYTVRHPHRDFGTQIDIFEDPRNRLRFQHDTDTTCCWWLRSDLRSDDDNNERDVQYISCHGYAVGSDGGLTRVSSAMGEAPMASLIFAVCIENRR